MKKQEWTIPAIVTETITALAALVYVGLQIFYGISYQIPVIKYLTNVLVVLLVCLALTLLMRRPELINRIPAEACRGKIREYSLWMIRWVKLIFVASLLIPCIADVCGIGIRSAYSAIVILLILGVSIGFEVKILQELRNSDEQK